MPLSSRILFGTLVLDRTERTASASGRQIQLSAAEFATLSVLIERRNTPISRDIIAEVLTNDGLAIPPRMVDVHICRLRQKLTSLDLGALIVTAWGRGYIAGAPPREDDGPLEPFGGSSAALLTA